MGNEVNYPIKCPTCEKEFDSMDSYADTKQMLREHIKNAHENQTK